MAVRAVSGELSKSVQPPPLRYEGIIITGLAFSEPDLTDQAKVGVLIASTIAAALATLVLARRPASWTRPT